MTLLVLAFVILLIIGMPVAFVVGLAGVAFFASTADLPFSIVVQRIVAQTQSYSFLAVPFFIFAGTLMNESGITQRILQFPDPPYVGRCRAGLGHHEHDDGRHLRFGHR